jgi:hypothetical protein
VLVSGWTARLSFDHIYQLTQQPYMHSGDVIIKWSRLAAKMFLQWQPNCSNLGVCARMLTRAIAHTSPFFGSNPCC